MTQNSFPSEFLLSSTTDISSPQVLFELPANIFEESISSTTEEVVHNININRHMKVEEEMQEVMGRGVSEERLFPSEPTAHVILTPPRKPEKKASNVKVIRKRNVVVALKKQSFFRLNFSSEVTSVRLSLLYNSDSNSRSEPLLPCAECRREQDSFLVCDGYEILNARDPSDEGYQQLPASSNNSIKIRSIKCMNSHLPKDFGQLIDLVVNIIGDRGLMEEHIFKVWVVGNPGRYHDNAIYERTCPNDLPLPMEGSIKCSPDEEYSPRKKMKKMGVLQIEGSLDELRIARTVLTQFHSLSFRFLEDLD